MKGGTRVYKGFEQSFPNLPRFESLRRHEQRSASGELWDYCLL